MTDIVESTQPEAVVASEREPTFDETLQSAASFCESLKRQGSADEWDFDYLIGKFRDAAFAVSLWDKARVEWLAKIASQAARIRELEEAAGRLADRNCTYDTTGLFISFDSHEQALAAMIDLRSLLSRKGGE